MNGYVLIPVARGLDGCCFVFCFVCHSCFSHLPLPLSGLRFWSLVKIVTVVSHIPQPPRDSGKGGISLPRVKGHASPMIAPGSRTSQGKFVDQMLSMMMVIQILTSIPCHHTGHHGKPQMSSPSDSEPGQPDQQPAGRLLGQPGTKGCLRGSPATILSLSVGRPPSSSQFANVTKSWTPWQYPK